MYCRVLLRRISCGIFVMKCYKKKLHPCCEDCIWINARICCCPSGLTHWNKTLADVWRTRTESRDEFGRMFLKVLGQTYCMCHTCLKTLLAEQKWNHSSTWSWKSPDVGWHSNAVNTHCFTESPVRRPNGQNDKYRHFIFVLGFN